MGDVGSAVVFVVDYMQCGKREPLCKAPNHTERRRNVEPATNEHRRNIGDAVGAPADAIRPLADRAARRTAGSFAVSVWQAIAGRQSGRILQDAGQGYQAAPPATPTVSCM
jgi:hypothetical protein